MNGEGYKDPTAEKAIANAEKPWWQMTEAEIYKIKKTSVDIVRMLRGIIKAMQTI